MNPMTMMRRTTLVALLLTPTLAFAGERNSATVSLLTGQANAGGRGLVQGGQVFEGETVETGPDARLELKTKDGSAVRVGPSSKLLLKSAYFGAGGEKSFSAKLMFGRVWTKVTGLVGGGSKFEVETDSAVAGVRGTTFRVDANTDKSVLMRVYAGSVAMASAALVQKQAATTSGTPRRTQIKAPTRVSEQEWEKLVGKMMQIAVNAELWSPRSRFSDGFWRAAGLRGSSSACAALPSIPVRSTRSPTAT
jgi:hypothetical protein